VGPFELRFSPLAQTSSYATAPTSLTLLGFEKLTQGSVKTTINLIPTLAMGLVSIICRPHL